MDKIIKVNDKITYHLQRKKIRNLYLKLKDNEIYVSAPFLYPVFKINEFVESKYSLINKHQNKAKKSYYDGDNVLLLGEYVPSYEYDRYMINESLRYIKERTFYYYKLMNLGDILPNVYIKDIKIALSCF